MRGNEVVKTLRDNNPSYSFFSICCGDTLRDLIIYHEMPVLSIIIVYCCMFQWTVTSQIFCSRWITWLLPRAETRYSRVWSTISVVTGWVLPKAASLQPGSVSVTIHHKKKNEIILRTTASSITSAAQFLTFYTKFTLYST